MKRIRTRLEAKIIPTHPVVLTVGIPETWLDDLKKHFAQKNCAVYHFSDLPRKAFPAQFVIIYNKDNQILAAASLAKKSGGRLLFVSDGQRALNSQLARKLTSVIDEGVALRFGQIDPHLSPAHAVQQIADLLFGEEGVIDKDAFKEMFAPPPLVIPYPPPPKPRQEPPPKPIKPKPASTGDGYGLSKLFKWSLVFLIPLAVVLPIFYLVLNFYSLEQQVVRLEDHLLAGKVTSSEVASTAQAVSRFDQMFTIFLKLSGPLGRVDYVRDVSALLEAQKQLIQVARHGVNLAKLGKDAGSVIFAHQEIPIGQVLAQMDRELKALEEAGKQAVVTLEQIQRSKLLTLSQFKMYQKKITAAKTSLQEGLLVLQVFKTILPSVPAIIGLEGKRVYLVLLQNNTELRPTGGFIGSYGLVSFDRGKMTDLSIEDVYAADGQLRGHIDPPAPLGKYLSLEHWYLRDSNFDPDFLASAQQAEWFLQKEVNTAVDGVIAVDLTFAKRVLDAIGGITLADYNERVTSDNFFLKAQVAAEGNFFPGSTQKRDFLASFSRALVRELTTGSNLPWLPLGKAIKSALDEKHLQLAFHDKRVQGVFDVAGWSGRVLPRACQPTTSPCVADYLLIVDTNVGVNKANYYLVRSYNTAINFARDEIDRVLTVHYRNNSPADIFPTGNYRSFTRLIIPQDAFDVTVFLDNRQVPPQELTQESFRDKRSIGLLVEVPVGAEKDLGLHYKLPTRTAARYTYQLLWQKQAGTDEDTLSLKVAMNGLTITSANIPLDNNGPFVYNSDLSTDRVFSFTIQ